MCFSNFDRKIFVFNFVSHIVYFFFFKLKIMMDQEQCAQIFAQSLATAKLSDLVIGSTILKPTYGVSDHINYNRQKWEDGSNIDMLDNAQEYTLRADRLNIQISLQLYENSRFHYRLFAYTKSSDCKGMVFSVNLTTEQINENSISLQQKIKFTEQTNNGVVLTKENREQKKIKMLNLLKKLGFNVTKSNDVILGSFSPKEGKFKNTTPDKFLQDFVTIAIIKGHFQGNKGYFIPDLG